MGESMARQQYRWFDRIAWGGHQPSLFLHTRAGASAIYTSTFLAYRYTNGQFVIPLPRGTILLLEGYAANGLKHCVSVCRHHDSTSQRPPHCSLAGKLHGQL